MLLSKKVPTTIMTDMIRRIRTSISLMRRLFSIKNSPSYPGSGLEVITNAPAGQDVSRLGRVFLQLFPQPPHRDVLRAKVAEVEAPDGFQKLLPGNTLPGF
jgi:hypothetical protein